MAGFCTNDFLSMLACLDQWRRRESSASGFFWGVNGEGRRRLERGGSSKCFPFWLVVWEMEGWWLNFNFFYWSSTTVAMGDMLPTDVAPLCRLQPLKVSLEDVFLIKRFG